MCIRDSYSVATFKWLGDFHGEQLAAVRKYALSFREQIRGMNRQRIEAKREQLSLIHILPAGAAEHWRGVQPYHPMQ